MPTADDVAAGRAHVDASGRIVWGAATAAVSPQVAHDLGVPSQPSWQPSQPVMTIQPYEPTYATLGPDYGQSLPVQNFPDSTQTTYVPPGGGNLGVPAAPPPTTAEQALSAIGSGIDGVTDMLSEDASALFALLQDAINDAESALAAGANTALDNIQQELTELDDYLEHQASEAFAAMDGARQELADAFGDVTSIAQGIGVAFTNLPGFLFDALLSKAGGFSALRRMK